MQAEDRLFERWRKRADADALGELFDLTAPRLLKLAIHLVGDAAAAEDLVQATFLAAIEQREQIDASRPILPWLSGVLTNKARAQRRAARRVVDVAQLAQSSEEEDASAPLERRELHGEVARAIDALEEPYRQVVLLRLRHGLGAADIAHVLARDSGTVRVQLHRGLEKLRGLLPAALASSLVLALVAPRGLAALRAHVLEQASLAAPAAVSSSLVGGLLVSKFAVALAALVVVALSLFFALRGGSPASGVREAVREPVVEAPRELAVAPQPADGTTLEVEERRETPAQVGAIWTVEVVDAHTKAPLSGAQVTRSQARTTTVPALLRERPAHFAMRNDGRLEPRTRADWPALAETSEPAFAGRAPLLALDTTEGAQVLQRTTSDAAGRALLDERPQAGLIEATLAGYAPRARPVVDGRMPARIELWPLRRVTGRCVFLGSEPRDKTFDLVIATQAPSVEGETPEGVGVFRVRTEADGTFTAEIAGSGASVDVLSLGWRPLHDVHYDLDGEEWTVTLRAWPVLRFLDATDRTPLETVHAVGHNAKHGFVAWSSVLHAPDGYLALPAPRAGVAGAVEANFKFWTPEHRAVLWRAPKATPSEPIEVLLEREQHPSLVGHVLRDSQALDGAFATLYAHGANLMWEPRQIFHTMLVDSAQTQAGRFALVAPAGTYLLEVQAGASRHTRVVQLPALEELVIDLARLAAVTVEVVDRAGAPQVGHIVAIHMGDQRSDRRRTDERGIASFTELPSLEGLVFAPSVNTDSSFGADVSERVVLRDGEQIKVKLVVRGVEQARHARVVARGVTSYLGWRVRFGESSWNALDESGVIPMDLATEQWTADVLATDGRRWSFDIPKDADDGHVIELEGGDAQLHGFVRALGDGSLDGWTIEAQPWRDCSATNSTRAAATLGVDGSFAFAALAPCEHLLRLYDAKHTLRVEFAPSGPAAPDSQALEIVLDPPRDSLRLRGVVRRASGAPVAGALVMAESLIPASHGSLRLVSEQPLIRTDEDGRYQLTLPRTPEQRVSVFPAHGRNRAHLETLVDDGRSERELDFTLD